MEPTALSIIPPIITIILALATKEVYMSLIIGIFTGALIFTGGNLLQAILSMFSIMGEKIGSNVNILIFLVILGILVAAISKSGATHAYGEWARQKIKDEKGALALTSFLGVLIFIDDYFNCLTVGAVMRPVTDKFKIARTKLAYIIDATAAPICIIAPVSSWAAAVGSSLPEDSKIDGFQLFLQTIPYNLYAWLTIVFVIFIIVSGRDFATMRDSIRMNRKKFLIPEEYKYNVEAEEKIAGKGKILDLVLPLIVLMVSCVYGMLYTGGIFEGKSIIDSFADCDASQALVLGSFMAFIFTAALYLSRKVVSLQTFCDCFKHGFRAMMPAIFILCLAWTLSGICSANYLNLGGYVGMIVNQNSSVMILMPMILFVLSAALACATGSSWGTFGILIPILVEILGHSYNVGNSSEMLVICVAAILSGSVSGDHSSPISDTTILASASAQCDHLDHVATQLPYVIVVSIGCLMGYFVDGLTENGWIGLGAGLMCVLWLLQILSSKTEESEEVKIDN